MLQCQKTTCTEPKQKQAKKCTTTCDKNQSMCPRTSKNSKNKNK